MNFLTYRNQFNYSTRCSFWGWSRFLIVFLLIITANLIIAGNGWAQSDGSNSSSAAMANTVSSAAGLTAAPVEFTVSETAATEKSEEKNQQAKTDKKEESKPKEEKPPVIQEVIPASKLQTVGSDKDDKDKDKLGLEGRGKVLADIVRQQIVPIEGLFVQRFEELLPEDALIDKSEKDANAPKVIPLDKIPQDVVIPGDEEASEPGETKVVEAKTPEGQTVLVKEEKPAAPQVEEKPLDSANVRILQKVMNPRALVKFFLENTIRMNYVDAVKVMDFSKMIDVSESEQQALAYKLRGILARLDNFNVEAIPEKVEGKDYYLWPDENYSAIILQKQKNGTWKFGSATIADIPRFYDEISSKAPVFTQKTWLRYLPEWSFKHVWGLTVIQWCFLALFFILGYIVYKISPFFTAYLILIPMNAARKGANYVNLTKRAIRPTAYLAMVYIWYMGLTFVQIPPEILSKIALIIHPFGIFMLTITVLRTTDLFGEWLRNRMLKRESKVGNVLVDLSTRSIKAVIVSLAVIWVAQIYGFSAWGIISGMGIGGIAVALAAQQTISNFFGSLTILLDSPFTVGDAVSVDGVEGVVETIGLRSTRIRTYYNSLVIIPNSSLATTNIDNLGRRLFRRYILTVGIQYDTPPALIEAFCGGMKTLVESYSCTRKDDIRIFVSEFADSSINIQVQCFFIVSSVAEENSAKHRLNMDVLKLANRMGVQFAFPSVTQYNIETAAPGYPIMESLNEAPIPEKFGQQQAQEMISGV